MSHFLDTALVIGMLLVVAQCADLLLLRSQKERIAVFVKRMGDRLSDTSPTGWFDFEKVSWRSGNGMGRALLLTGCLVALGLLAYLLAFLPYLLVLTVGSFLFFLWLICVIQLHTQDWLAWLIELPFIPLEEPIAHVVVWKYLLLLGGFLLVSSAMFGLHIIGTRWVVGPHNIMTAAMFGMAVAMYAFILVRKTAVECQ